MSTLSANCRVGLEFLENVPNPPKADYPLGLILAVDPKVRRPLPTDPDRVT